MIKKYFKKIEQILDKHNHIIEDQTIHTMKLADDKGYIEGEVFFIDETTLDFLEVVNTNKIEKERYKYHYMNKDKQLIFRYDNAQHHRDLDTFPHHKHTEKSVVESKEPNLEIVLVEIENKIVSK